MPAHCAQLAGDGDKEIKIVYGEETIFFLYQSIPLCTVQFPVDSNKFCDLSLLYWVGGQCDKKNLLHYAPSLSLKAELWALEAHVHKTTNAPLTHTALYGLLLMPANPLLGQVGGGLGPGLEQQRQNKTICCKGMTSPTNQPRKDSFTCTHAGATPPSLVSLHGITFLLTVGLPDTNLLHCTKLTFKMSDGETREWIFG